MSLLLLWYQWPVLTAAVHLANSLTNHEWRQDILVVGLHCCGP
jgi:hypothetical protein